MTFAGIPMATSFIPEIWAAEAQVKLDDTLVFGSRFAVNRDYEGEIADQGDTVRIPNLADPEVVDYTAYTSYDYKRLDISHQDLKIDRGKATFVKVDDVEQAQTAAGFNILGEASRRMGYVFAHEMDTHIGAQMATAATQVEMASAPTTGDAFYKGILKLRTLLSDNGVPLGARFLVINPAAEELLLDCDKFIAAANYGNAEPIQNGRIGSIVGFNVLVTQNMPAGPLAIAGHPLATTVAQQIVRTEPERLQGTFASAVKMLNVYGMKVLEPKALTKLTVKAG
ncbi:hypothetical protein ACQEU3_12225 [Spirillospora sp. CA-253888]